MVKIGNFTLELVEADSKIPFGEHLAPGGDGDGDGDGRTFAEVEPDAEYFIRLASDVPDLVRVYVHVDGTNLGHGKHLRNKSTLVGLLRQTTTTSAGGGGGDNKSAVGESKHTALRFKKQSGNGDSSASATAPPPPDAAESWTGTVRADFYEAIDTGKYVQSKDFRSPWQDRRSSSGTAASIGVVVDSEELGSSSIIMQPRNGKSVETAPGWSAAPARPNKRRRKRRTKGKLLESVELRYCTALGLIHHKVLRAPDGFWDRARMRAGARACAVVPIVTPERKRRRLVDGRGRDLGDFEEYDYFDLTRLPEEEGEDGPPSSVEEGHPVPDTMSSATPSDVIPGQDDAAVSGHAPSPNVGASQSGAASMVQGPKDDGGPSSEEDRHRPPREASSTAPPDEPDDALSGHAPGPHDDDASQSGAALMVQGPAVRAVDSEGPVPDDAVSGDHGPVPDGTASDAAPAPPVTTPTNEALDERFGGGRT